MDQQEGNRKRARGEEEEGDSPAVMMTALAAAAAAADALAETAFQEAAPAVVEGGDGDAWQRPPGVFEFPWLKCRGGLGVPASSAVAELQDVFFRSLVDGHVAAIGVPGDRFIPPPSNRTLFDDLAEWLATASEGEVDSVWRSVLEGPKPAA